MIYDKFDALMSLKPNGQYSWSGYDYSGLKGSDKPTESEIDDELVRLNNLEPMRLLRVQRDLKLTECDWTQSRDITLSNDNEWKTYRQALRDLPSSASPKLNSEGNLDFASVTWPTKPS